ncbi:MAG: class I SAM-dependent methyltransferase [Chloroflexota bacterium]|nr:class I SAM-dependent methyltransferase [Chloroflexota bacterium]
MISRIRALATLGVDRSLKLNRAKGLGAETIRGYYTTQVLIALINVGLMAELGSGRGVQVVTFAKREGLDEGVLQNLFDYLYELRFLDQSKEGYALTEKGMLAHEMLTGVILSVYAYKEIFSNLEALLRGEMIYGVDINRRSEFVAVGSGHSAELLAIPILSNLLLEKGWTRILDMACGDARFLSSVCMSNPNFLGFGVDIAPEAIEAGNRDLMREGLSDRVHLSVGDMFAMDTSFQDIPEIDVCTCVYALHEFLDDGNGRLVELLQGYLRRFPGVPMVVCEVIHHSPAELRRKPGGLMEIQLMHHLSNQRLATREEWREIFGKVGFNSVSEIYLDYARTAVFTAV